MLSLVHAILRRAERAWEWLERAPTIPLLPEPQRGVRWLTHDEADRLLAELPEHLAAMAAFSLYTGLREANVTGLRWDQVDLGRRVAWIRPDQAKARRAIGVNHAHLSPGHLAHEAARLETQIRTISGTGAKEKAAGAA